ncbi:transcriptional regulator [Campylobacter sp. MIT 12-8780]|uniref:Rrf2 family transcriptional regulator n=1 Tax=unclassified Campylobacter TaxID=2593542 RepID=UPI0010F55761|nr:MULTISPECIES: Rrf2 family transcriptional regulator [unclassified Campylobacter]NDJ27995.1 Rrf2 family transcriptional regulator [Campylobacter sp. MIT 19-121]TKX28322.1 transcriptional regulator [Campylobacter sp. MIT 12-5580]TQR40487.1 transcriptional regulator [Campylobacter sp. MIT 12-8780]
MLFTRASEYALLALIYICDKDKPQDVETMAFELDISRSFLAKILQGLAKDGLLHSYKGAKGGFTLVKKPEEYTLKEIVDSAEKKQVSVFECSQGVCPTQKGDKCYMLPVLKDLQEKMNEHLNSVSLADIIKKS